MIKRPISWLWCIVFTISFWIVGSPVPAKDKAKIEDTRISREEPHLKADFLIQHCFNPEMDEAIWSGVPTTFRIFVVLEEAGHLFFSPKLLDTVLEHTIKYDRLKEEFRVSLSESPDEIRVTPRFLEAKQWMSHVKGLSLIPLWRLEKDHAYQLSVKAELSKVRLPLFLRYIFFFVSLWDFETEWNTTTFNF